MAPILSLQLEVVAAAAVVLTAVGFILAARPQRGRGALAIAVVVAVAGLGLAAARARSTGEQALDRLAVLAEIPQVGREDDDFASADGCRACHPAEYDSWHGSFHRTMTQVATPETVTGDFDDVRLVVHGRTTHLRREGDAFNVTTIDPDWEQDLFLAGVDPDTVDEPPSVETRVVMITGSHHYQSYWIPSARGNKLVNFHWAWLHETQEWVPREAAFMRPPGDPRLHQFWNDNCIHCHAVDGDPRVLTNPAGEHAMDTSVAELGISCESCHGPAAEHVALNTNPVRRMQLHLERDAGDPSIVHPQRIDPARSSETCGGCHSINMPMIAAMRTDRRFRAGETLAETKYVIRGSDRNLETEAERRQWRAARDYLLQQDPRFFEDRYWSDGMVRISGRDYNGMIESPCVADPAFGCLSCHSMHDYVDPADQLRPGMDGNDACLQCHAEIGADVSAHTHHAPDSAGSSCYACHMPHTVFGLLKAIRSHEISSPDVATSIEVGRPDACSLCHLDRPLEWTAERLESWYGIPQPALSDDDRNVAAAVRWLVSGDAGQRALAAWHVGHEPAIEASGARDWAAPLLARLLDDPYDAVRYVAARSYRTLTGDPLDDWTFTGEAAAEGRTQAATTRIEAGIAAAFDGAQRTAAEFAAILRDAAGRLDAEALARLHEMRDDSRVDLKE